MKPTLTLLITTLLLLPLAALHATDAPAKKPNIVVILTDDHGWADLGAQGVDPHIRTPNVDRLALDGVRFTRGYVTAPQCTPSRAGLMSGRYQNKFGVEQNFDPMPSAVVTLPEHLKKSGYNQGGVLTGPLSDFTLQWHDGTAWQDIPDAKVTANRQIAWSALFTPVETTRLRLVITATPGGVSRIWEVELYAPPTTSQP